ncbi:MAG: polysaccharide ABC transporter ATP-binding protein [Acidobacteriota bacterium]|nr:polysaccharide ABC transporter ATP-binding protein [Acidobacteriota bacterium]
MSDITVNNVSKRYWIRSSATEPGRHKPRFMGLFSRRDELFAIKNVSFRVERGEAVGIVGQNGAGKSTILKLLSGITAPTEGEITIRGRLSALVEISSGFHPELTGRENIFMSGSILGMSRGEIAHKVESIIEFSGVRRFIDVPVKRYSSGMSVRLGFSVAAHLEPDILLLDEVLAVGDAAFQARCLDRIAELRNKGKTILFTSHDLAALERLCSCALLLERGELIMSDSPRRVIEEYLSRTFASLPTSTARPIVSSGAAELLSLEFAQPDGGPVKTGCAMITRLMYKASTTVEDATFSLSFYWPSGYLCTQLTTAGRLEPMTLHSGTGMVEFFCPTLVMQRGLYNVDVAIERNGELIVQHPRCSVLRVDPGTPALGDFYMEHHAQIRDIGV